MVHASPAPSASAWMLTRKDPALPSIFTKAKSPRQERADATTKRAELGAGTLTREGRIQLRRHEPRRLAAQFRRRLRGESFRAPQSRRRRSAHRGASVAVPRGDCMSVSKRPLMASAAPPRSPTARLLDLERLAVEPHVDVGTLGLDSGDRHAVPALTASFASRGHSNQVSPKTPCARAWARSRSRSGALIAASARAGLSPLPQE